MKNDRSRPLVTRRQIVVGGIGFGGLVALGCGSDSITPGMDGGGVDGATDTGVGFDSGPVDLSRPEIGASLWQTMSAYARANEDGSLGTRINLYNPAPVPHRVVIQIFRSDGTLVVKDMSLSSLPSEQSWHFELREFLVAHSVPLPFEGSIWVGATPVSGEVFMGLQGISFDWYGPAHMASVHGMRDFGNSNHDGTWTDLVLPKFVNGPRYVTKLAILNASGDGVAEGLAATPELILRSDAGAELVRTTLDPIPVYATRLVDLSDVLSSVSASIGTIQLIEPEVGLAAVGFVVDTNNNGFTTADHLFDRHFVVDNISFVG